MHNRVLIVGTIPYNENTSSRAFDAYFHNWEKENLRQIFSNTKTPTKGHCGSLYQITDFRLLKRRFNHKIDTGVIFNYEDLPDKNESNDLEIDSKIGERFYKSGSRKNSFKKLLRKILWKKKYWCTDKLRSWLEDFKPECVFIAFSSDFFILEIALFVADYFNIPIMACIGDDYYFNKKKTFSPFYRIYKNKYRRIVDKVFSHKCSAIYISNKIRNKYNSYFKINGDTVYLPSDIIRKEFKEINTDKPLITYCGNIRTGRNESLLDIANALQRINSDYHIQVYSAEKDKKFIKPMLSNKGIEYKGFVPYNMVKKLFEQSDITIIVESFKQKYIDTVRYSLSTKAADSISSGCNILTYGSSDCGVVEYMLNSKCSAVCLAKENLIDCLNKFLFDVNFQKELYENGENILNTNHNKNESNKKSEMLFDRLIHETNE